jgi:peptide subunit release factor 1 (eRF1)
MQSRVFSKNGLCHFLSSLEAQAGDFVTVYAEPDDFPDFVEKLSLQPKYNVSVGEIKSAVKAKAVMSGARRYDTGAAIFWGQVGRKYIVLPPFPIAENKVSVGSLDTSVLYGVLERRHVIGVVLVAWGSYAIGIFDADNLVELKTGTGHIHKEHKKGGRSQKRFARRTEEQRKDFLRRVANRIEEKFGGFAPDYILFGGNRLIAKPLIRECRYLQSNARKISLRVLDVRHADREALVSSLAEITKSVVFTF